MSQEKQKKNVFIVEDDDALRRALILNFKKDFNIDEAEDGKAALEFLKKNKPDIILLDIGLPYVNGMDVLKFIRKTDSIKNIPVIIISNLDDQNLVAQGLILGARDYLAKSNYSLDDIVEMVKMRLR